ncbi:MAG: response regulator transcription factor [Bryobacterales bacterium]
MNPPSPVRLYILDDHALFREALARLLDSDSTIDVVGTAGSTDRCWEDLQRLKPDILILDYDLGEENTLDFVARLREARLDCRILLVTAGLPDEHALGFIKMGVAGVFHKQKPPEDLHASIREVATGRILIDQSYLQSLVSTATQSKARLTERDKSVLRFLVEGRSNKEIAAELSVSESAVKSSLQQLFAKTGVRTRSQLVRVALEDYRGEI